MNYLYHVIHIVFLHKSKIHVLYSPFFFLFCKTPNSSCSISCKHNPTSSFSQLKQEIVWVTLLEISFLISYLKPFWTEVQMVLHKDLYFINMCTISLVCNPSFCLMALNLDPDRFDMMVTMIVWKYIINTNH